MDTEAEAAFQEMKALILELPSLTTPRPKEQLSIYLAASKGAVSAVLVVERDGRQLPVHYVIRTLHEAERNYTPMEKLALCLLNASRRLRRYFEAHPIRVITDQPVKQILYRPEVSLHSSLSRVTLSTSSSRFFPLSRLA